MATLAGTFAEPRTRLSARRSSILQTLLFVPLVRWFCRPLRVCGRDHIPDGPVVYVANHASHADTAAIIAALPKRTRTQLAPAAAEDYFFRGPFRGAIVRALTGAFPFPRRGDAGLRRAQQLLAEGRSVLLFPEGTRTRTGSIARFHRGAGRLASLGYRIVPVGICGTSGVMPVNGKLPRRAPVSIAFGDARSYAGRDAGVIVRDLEGRVRTLVEKARTDLPQPRRTIYARANRIAESRAGIALAFCWGIAEAIAWPVVPDFAVALLAAAAPRRFWRFALAAVCGSMIGGTVAYLMGPAFGPTTVEHLPLVTHRMHVAATEWLRSDGGWALWHQIGFGVPYKVYAWNAAGSGVDYGSFALGTMVARGIRILAVGSIFAGIAIPWRRWADRFYGAFAVLFTAAFAIGLARVVQAWT